MIFRHGDRSPEVFYLDNSYGKHDWLKEGAQGFGQLTYVRQISIYGEVNQNKIYLFCYNFYL